MLPLLWVVGLLLTNAAAADNLLTNPSFEQAPVAAGLAPPGWSVASVAPVEQRSDGGHEGQSYLRVHDPASDKGATVESRPLPARPGGVYTATAWFRTTDHCRPGLYINFYDLVGERVHHLYARADPATGQWVRVSVSTAAPQQVATVSVLLYGFISDVGSFDVDDVTLSVEGGREPGAQLFDPARPGSKSAYEIGDRLELFLDDFLIDGTAGAVERRLHHPVPREVILEMTQPWEGQTATYLTVFEDQGMIRLYYRGSAPDLGEVTCLAESPDGIHFSRTRVGLFETGGSKENNIVWSGVASHNFSPFRDPRADIPDDERYKAIGYGAGGKGLFAYASPDGVHWRLLLEAPIITKGDFDSHNLAFWDAQAGLYRDYHRAGRDGVRDIMTCTSPDFRTWTEPTYLDYGDAPREHLYTNNIMPYPRAPHIFIGLPARFVPGRTKFPEHKEPGISDAVLMSSRDGLRFSRWVEAFLRPGTDWQVWTDRNNYPAWGMVQTSPDEISLYWTEHYRHPTMRFRRGTIRTDGFVSVHAGAEAGEIITRPLVFLGSKLLVNYATSAVGWLRFELCDESGIPLPGFALSGSECLYGNEIEHQVRWEGDPNLGAYAGQRVRLRVQLRDADLYSIRFAQ